MTRILVADDDRELCELLEAYLANEGFDVDAVHDGLRAVEQASAGEYDLMVLDVMMPGQTGFDALRELRAKSRLPVLMLTARGEDVDRIVGLEMGADDYLAKPANPRELVARIRAILRRVVHEEHDEAEGPQSVGDLTLIPGTRTCRVAGDEIDLTGAEFSVLKILVDALGTVVSKEALTREALGRKLGRFDRSIDVHVSNLRKKLGPACDGSARIKTVRGAGYLYVHPEPGE